MFWLENHSRWSSTIQFPLDTDHEERHQDVPVWGFLLPFHYMAASIEMEDHLPKIQVLPDKLERNRGVEVEGIHKEMVITVDTRL